MFDAVELPIILTTESKSSPLESLLSRDKSQEQNGRDANCRGRFIAASLFILWLLTT
jgi:hypothetical protein